MRILILESSINNREVLNSNNFKIWFKNSQIVDKMGEPLLVYHGTKEDFKDFNEEMMGRNFSFRFGRGFYFTESKAVAEDFGQIKKAYLSIKNPLEVNSVPQYRGIIEKEKSRIGINRVERDRLLIKDNTDILMGMGYDGVIYWHNNKMAEIVVFKVNQIKTIE